MREKLYLAGDMLKKGSRMLRGMEATQLMNMGYKVYNPKDDKEINDKANQTEESNSKLAEKIVYKDTKGIRESEIIVIEPTDNALGTICELGQIKGMKDIAKDVLKLLEDNKIEEIKEMCEEMVDKRIYPHYEDIRRTNIPESGDRRSWGINQYVYGICLDLTGGEGLYDWEYILKILGGKENE